MSRVRPPTPSPLRWRGSSIPGAVAVTLLLAVGACSAGGGGPVASSTARPASTASPATNPTTLSPTTGPTTAASPSTVAPATASASALPSSTAPAASPSSSQAAGFPVTVTDDEGTMVTLEVEPKQIVSLSPANSETVFALGAGDRLVGGTDADDYPAEAKALPDVATFQGVQVEKVLDLGADLVLAAGNDFTPPADVKRLRDLGIPVVVLYAETVDEVLADIELIGRAVGAADEAAAMTASMRSRLEATRLAAQDGPAPRVFYQIGSEPDIYGPADESFVADLIVLAGGEPITTGDKVSFTMPLERLVEADPEVIIVGDANYGVTPEAVMSRGGAWALMSAVRKGQVRPVDDVIVTRPGPRLADGLAALAVAIDPELSLPTASPTASPTAPAAP